MSIRSTINDVAGSTPFDNSTNGFTADDVQAAIEEVESLASPLRVPITLVYNGTLSNGDFIGYSNLLPGDATPIIIPISGSFVGFTWSNKVTGADFALEFRLGSTTATPFFTWTVTNTQIAEVAVPAEAVTAGGTMYVKYLDQGQNAQDATIVLLFRS